MKLRKKIYIPILIFLIIIYVNQSSRLKFLLEILKISSSLPTISSDFYNEPINDISYKDLIYKERNGQKLKLDLYMSNELNEPKPVIIYVFGNGWMYGDKSIPSAISSIIDLLKDEGFAVISTSYELMNDEVILDKQISDVKDTIRWVYKNKDKYNFDVDNIGIIGPSAGAQLSMVAAFSNDDDFKGDESLSNYSSKVKYIVDLFGPAKLDEINLSVGPSEIVNKFTESDIGELSKKFSPINYVHKKMPDTLIVHSVKDAVVPYQSSKDLYDKALEYNNNFEFYTLENCNHYLENLSQSEALSLYMKIVDYILSKSR